MLTPTMIAIPFFASMIAIEAFPHGKHSDEYNDNKDTRWGNIFLGFMSVVWGRPLVS